MGSQDSQKKGIELLFTISEKQKTSIESTITDLVNELSKKIIQISLKADTTAFEKSIEDLVKNCQEKLKTLGETAQKTAEKTTKEKTQKKEETKQPEIKKAEKESPVQKNAFDLDKEKTIKVYTKAYEKLSSNAKLAGSEVKALGDYIKATDEKLESSYQTALNTSQEGATGYNNIEEVKKFQQQLADIKNSSKVLDKSNITEELKYPEELDKLSVGLTKWQSKVQDAGARYKDLIRTVGEGNNAYKAAKDALERYENALKSAENSKISNGGKISRQALEEAQKAQAALIQQFNTSSTTLARLEQENSGVFSDIYNQFVHTITKSAAELTKTAVLIAFKKVIQNVIELDKNITDLQIATGLTRRETGELIKSYSKLAQKLGATTKEVAEAADTWLRQGYSIQQANELIESTMMLSKLGQLESAEASRALTSAMKGYGKSVSDVMSIVDKFTAVDMKAAVTAGDIATAMAETATGAKIAGVSMDKLIGYISVVSEVTQDGAESVGTFYKTMFARIGNVKAGKFVDDETGESLNDVEKVLGKLGISLRDRNNEFRNFGYVLDEVGQKWDTYNSTQKRALATAFAGTRQQEKFIVLMENYGKAMEYENISQNSEGTAQTKYEDAYMSGIDARLQTLKASWEEFSLKFFNSSLVTNFLETINAVVKVLSNDVIGGIAQVATSIGVLVGGLTIVEKLFNKLTDVALTGFATSLEKTAKTIKDFKKIRQEKKDAKNKVSMEIAGERRLFEGRVKTTKGTDTIKEFINYRNRIKDIKKEAKGAGKSMNELTDTSRLKRFTTKLKSIPDTLEKSNGIVFLISKCIAVIVALVGGVGKIIENVAKKREAEFEALKETAEMAQAEAEKASETSKKVNNITREYRELLSSNEGWEADGDSRKKAIELQNELNDAVGHEGKLIDLNADTMEGRNQAMEKLLEKQKKLAKEAEEAALKSFNAQKDAYEGAHITDRIDVGGWNILNRDKLVDITFDTAVGSYSAGDNVIDMIKSWGDANIYADEKGTIGDMYGGVSLKGTTDQKIAALKRIIEGIKTNGIDKKDGGAEILAQFSRVLQAYEEQKEKYDAALENTINATVNSIAADKDDTVITTLHDFYTYKKQVEDEVYNKEQIKKWINDSGISEEERNKRREIVAGYVRDILKENYGSWVDQANEFESHIPTVKGYVAMLKEVEKEYDALAGALDDIAEKGIISSDKIQELTKSFPELTEKYFKLGEDGYVLNDDFAGKDKNAVIDSFITDYLQEYVNELDNYAEGSEGAKNAQKNFNDALAVCQTLLRSNAIEEHTKQLEKQQDTLKNQLEKYQDINKVRQDLLNSYKEELSYQKQLADKEKNVADLRTELALLSLDNSASGKAKYNEVKKQLEDAETDLADFTLEKAVEKLLKEIDKDNSEYNKFIDSQVNAIKEEIEKLPEKIGKEMAEKIKELTPQSTHAPVSNYDEIKAFAQTQVGNKEGGSDSIERILSKEQFDSQGGKVTLPDGKTLKEYLTYQAYLDDLYKYYGGKFHSGGFVGDMKDIKSNEMFAKLMKGEYVATPKQIQNFTNKTLPKIARGGETQINNNSPLIQITCGSITEDVLPELNDMINEAAKRIEKNMANSLNRAGYRKTI